MNSGISKRELLGHQLADHQRGEGREHDHQAETDRLGGVRIDAQQGQPLAHRIAQARARISAGENADQGDADLHRRQEAPGLGGELERAFRARRSRSWPSPSAAPRATTRSPARSSTAGRSPRPARGSGPGRAREREGAFRSWQLQVPCRKLASGQARPGSVGMRNHRRVPPFPTQFTHHFSENFQCVASPCSTAIALSGAVVTDRLHHRPLYRPAKDQ